MLFMSTSRVRHALMAGATAALALTSVPIAHAGAEPFVGEMMLFGGNYCPQGWAAADGALVSISSNSALFSLLGTTYGGDGKATFGLPNLQGRVPVGVGTGPGLATVALGEAAGMETVTLTQANMPTHAHGITVSTEPATLAAPVANGVLAQAQNGGVYAPPGGATVALQGTTVAGGSQPFSVRNPYLAMQWCIAVIGIYPTRP